jgi:hypothetical protein
MKLREWMYSTREICGGKNECKPRDRLGMTHQLIREQQYRFEGELAVAEVEEILKRRPEEIKDHRVVIALGAEPPHKRHANTTSEGFVDLALVFELGVLSLDRLELDSDLFAGNNVDAEVDVTWTTLSAMPQHCSHRKTHQKIRYRSFCPDGICRLRGGPCGRRMRKDLGRPWGADLGAGGGFLDRWGSCGKMVENAQAPGDNKWAEGSVD